MPLSFGFKTRTLCKTLALGVGLSVWPLSQSLAETCQLIAELEAFPQTAAAPSDAVCRSFTGSAGAKGVFCWWSFPLRGTEAPQFAKTVWSGLRTCRAGSESGADQQVNHPDSYALREWVGEKNTYSVAVKDKVSRQRTLVFLRFQNLVEK